MEYPEQLSIDAILMSPSYDINTVRLVTHQSFENERMKTVSRIPRPTKRLDTPEEDIDLTPTPQLTNPYAPSALLHPRPLSLGALSIENFEMSALTSSYLLNPTYCTSDDYDDGSPDSTTSLTLVHLPPSLVTTPTTPRSPLLPTFPDLEFPVSIYKDIPFSPTVPSFSDCPFRHYRDDIPPSKSRQSQEVSLRLQCDIPTWFETLVDTSPTTTIADESEDEFADEDYNINEGTILIDYDADDEMKTENEANCKPKHERITSILNLERRISHTRSFPSVGYSRVTLGSPSNTTSNTQEHHIDTEIQTWYMNMSLNAQLQELERTYTNLNRQRLSMQEPTHSTTGHHASQTTIEHGPKASRHLHKSCIM